MNETAIKIQLMCRDRFIELLPLAIEGKLSELKRIRHPLTTGGMRSIMKLAIAQGKEGYLQENPDANTDSYFPYTKEVIDLWLDRAIIEKARRQ